MSIPATMRALQQAALNGPRDLHLITGAPVPYVAYQIRAPSWST